MWMAAGNAYSLVCAPVERLGEHSCKPCPEEAGPSLPSRNAHTVEVNFTLSKIS